jgi:Pyruvate/2-oxoacid:ferredoxin oxidoreductase delta subunit
MLLLAEAVQMIEAAELIAVQPCDCRRLGESCSRPVAACLLLNDAARDLLDRGHGRALSRQEGIDLLHRLDRQGLMHTADPDWRQNGAFYICNCCRCDCYPLRAAEVLGSKGIWPQVRYLAAHDQQRCRSCGACVKRCHYTAFEPTGQTVEIEGKSRQRVSFVAERCWGCGLCANTCPQQAITMQPISE